MPRTTWIFGMEEWDVLPFASIARDALAVATVTVTIEEGVELWWVNHGLMLNLLFHVDPATSASSATTYTRQILLERELYDAVPEEWAVLYPGPEIDLEFPAGSGGPAEYYGGMRWRSGNIAEGADDVFNSTDILVELDLFTGGYASGGAGLLTFTVKLRFSMTYDDGSEGTITLQTLPTLDPDPSYFEATSCDFLGGSFTLRAGDSAGFGSSLYMTAPIEVELVPCLWLEYRRSNGTEPIYDSATGTVLSDPLSALE